MKNYYVFVEGLTDKLFIERIICDKLSLLDKNTIIIEYSTMPNRKIKSFINSINQMGNADYIFLADQDGRQDKKQKILSTYPFLKEEKVFLSIYEIESWIISGISQKLRKKFNINSSWSDTSIITKELFEQLIPNSVSRLEFISFLLDEYNIDVAISLNNSLQIFYNYLESKKAS